MEEEAKTDRKGNRYPVMGRPHVRLRLMELVMKGVGPEEIAEAVGVTKRTVQGRLAAGGVAIGDRGMEGMGKGGVGGGGGGGDKRMMRQVADAWNAYLEAGQKEGKTVVEMEAEAAKTELIGKDGGGIEPEVNDAESVT